MQSDIGIKYETENLNGTALMHMIVSDFSNYKPDDLSSIRKVEAHEIGKFIDSIARKSKFPSFLEEQLMVALFVRRGEYLDLIARETILKMALAGFDLDNKERHIPSQRKITTSLTELHKSSSEATFLTRNKTENDCEFDLNYEMSILDGISIKGIETVPLTGTYLTKTQQIIERFDCEGKPIIYEPKYKAGIGARTVREVFFGLKVI